MLGRTGGLDQLETMVTLATPETPAPGVLQAPGGQQDHPGPPVPPEQGGRREHLVPMAPAVRTELMVSLVVMESPVHQDHP